MSVVTIKVNGKDYQVACDDGEEERLHWLAEEVNDRIQSLTFGMKSKPSEAMALLLAGLMMADELSEKQKETENLVAESKRAIARASVKSDSQANDARMAEIEAALAVTMEEIATRIERIADKIEIA